MKEYLTNAAGDRLRNGAAARNLARDTTARLDPWPLGTPRLLFRGDTAGLGDLRTWRNEGHTGAEQSLLNVAGGVPPKAYAGGPNGHSYVRFVGNDWMETPGLLGIAEADPYAWCLVFRPSDTNGAGRNVVGFGRAAPPDGAMADAYYQGTTMNQHRYGPTVSFQESATSSPLIIGAWNVAFVNARGPQFNSVETKSINSIYRSKDTRNYPAASPLHLGGGMWNNFNTPIQVDIAHFELFDDVTFTDYQVKNFLTRIATTYKIPA